MPELVLRNCCTYQCKKADYNGITVANDTALRKELREAGVEYTVVKNTLLKLAIKDTELESMGSR